jgi:hypothetical protein
VLVLLLLPMALLFIGRVLLPANIGAAFVANLPSVPPVLAHALVIAALYGGLSMAVSAYTPRRAYATAGIIALLILPAVVTGIVIAIGSGPVGTGLVLVSPNTILDGTNALFFDHSLGEEYFFVDLPRWAFLISAIVEVAVAVALILRRFARITI